MWLETRHASSKGLWLKITKRGSGIETVTYAEALDVAPCYAWIDGQEGAVDDRWWLQRFIPRGSRSRWSKTNCAQAIALIEAGQMHPAGLWEWSGHEPTAGGRRPTTRPRGPRPSGPGPRCQPRRQAFFATLDRTNRYAIPYRIHDAKRPATRARRIKTFAVMLGRGEKPYP
ncbi:MAG TPA: YdeI/OmpD-associated family protein [Actinomycetota bacterium]